MQTQQQPNVAILLATYNGARYVAAQIASLAGNSARFTLHWLDDHSSDNTCATVRSAAKEAGIELREWHQSRHLGFPCSFLHLLECADADIYLFCDQDDIWEPGKIDAVAANLSADIAAPVFSFSDPRVFYETAPDVFYRLSDIGHTKAPAALQASRAFLSCPAAGQSVGFTRALRDLYMSHKDVARTHALGHSWWLYLLAVAAGEVRLLKDVPTTLYRQHGSNVSGAFFARNQGIVTHAVLQWRLHQALRQGMARQARGFTLASSTLPRGTRLEQLLSLATVIETIDRRQSPLTLARLLLRRAMWPHWSKQFWLGTACLWTDATPAHAATATAGEESRLVLPT